MLHSSFETTELKQLRHRKFMEKFKSSITGGLAPSENFMDAYMYQNLLQNTFNFLHMRDTTD